MIGMLQQYGLKMIAVCFWGFLHRHLMYHINLQGMQQREVDIKLSSTKEDDRCIKQKAQQINNNGKGKGNSSFSSFFHFLITFMILWNPITYQQIAEHPQNIIVTVLILKITKEYLRSQFKQEQKIDKNGIFDSKLNIVIIIGIVLLQKYFIPFIGLIYLLQMLKQPNKLTNIIVFFILLASMGLKYIYIPEQTQNLQVQTENGLYNKVSDNPMWLLFSHLFIRYIPLYSTFMTIIPFTVIWPLSILNHKKQKNQDKFTNISFLSIKLACMYLLCAFTMRSPCTTSISIYGLYILYMIIYQAIYCELKTKTQRREDNEGKFQYGKLMIRWNVLTIILCIVTLPSYAFYHHTLKIWLNTHMVSIGYVLVQILLFWVPHFIYLNEALILSFQIQQKNEKKPEKLSFKQRMKGYIQKCIKNM